MAADPLPYHWYPDGAHPKDIPEPGDLLPWQHAVYVVIESTPTPEDLWTDQDRERMAHVVAAYRERTVPRRLLIRPLGDANRNHERGLSVPAGQRLPVYPNAHFPTCGTCGEPSPCRVLTAERLAGRVMARFNRYETAGICPACEEPVTSRQRSHTWQENAEVVGGPPVMFHLRRRCVGEAVSYERRWVAADPEHRRAWLSCPGHVVNHNDGTYACTELTECPGPHAAHPSYTVCRCPDCHARGTFGCTPAPTARNAALPE